MIGINRFQETGFDCDRLEYIGDSIGVAIAAQSRVLGIIPRLLYRLRMPPLARLAQAALRVPEYVYLAAIRCGLNPQRIGYFRAFPFGFTFQARKP